MKRSTLVAAALITVSIFISALEVQAGGDFLGDYCWAVDDGSGAGPTLKVGVYHIGGSHFQVLGTAKTSTDGTYLVRGNLEIIGNEIQMFTTMADGNNNAMSTLDSVAVLDSGTLNGSYNMLHAGAAENGETLIRFSKGTMASIPCE